MTDDSPVYISVGIAPFIGTIGENEILSRFSIQSPEVELNITYDNNTNIIHKLQNKDLDAAFILVTEYSRLNKSVYDKLANDDFKIIKLIQNNSMYVGISINHPLADKDTVYIEDLLNEIFILPVSLEESVRKGMVSFLNSMINKKDCKLTPMYMDYTNKDLVLSVVERGKAILPEIALPMDNNARIKYVKVADWTSKATGMFVFRKNNSPNQLRPLIKLVKEYSAASSSVEDEKQPE